MPFKPGTTVAEARAEISRFLGESGCYDICAQCPVYPGGVGCCHGCGKLARNEAGEVTGCGSPNLSCLSYTCGTLNEHLRRQPSNTHANRLDEFTDLIYGMPREGYRGCEKRPEDEVLQIENPLELVAGLRREPGAVVSQSHEEETS